MMDTFYSGHAEIAAGQRALNINRFDEREDIILPYSVNERYCMMQASVRPVTFDIIDVALTMIRRISPWEAVTFSPRIVKKCLGDVDINFYNVEIDNKMYHILDGLHSNQYGIFLSLEVGPQLLLSTAAHEAWHAIESRLSDQVVSQLNDHLGECMYGHDDDYYSSPCERRARLFAAWCAPWFEGMPPRAVSGRIDQFFNDAWTGRLGAMLD